MKTKALAALLLTVLVSCRGQKVDPKAEGEKLMQLSRDWSQSASARNVEKTLSYWADDAVVMSPGQPVIKGKEAIRQMVEESYKIPGFRISWEPQSAEVSKSGDLAYLIEQEQISMNDSSGKTFTRHNKAITIWKKQAGGSWKNVVDISTADLSSEK